MSKIDAGIVILHYLNMEDTVECVQSFLEKLDTEAFHIVVVDNASPDGSGMLLQEKYAGENRVSILLNERNAGFSVGNNAGIRFLRENFDPEFIIVSNNDIHLLEDQFYGKIDEAYQNTEFAVMGPMIYTADGRYDSNPIFDFPYTREAALWQKKKQEQKLRRYQSPLYPINLRVYGFCRRIRSHFVKEVVLDSSSRRIGDAALQFCQRENVVLHGSFLIFSPRYFENFSGLDERTFLYAEEDILQRHMEKAGLKMLYNPDIKVYHKEGRSVSKSRGLNRDKPIFIAETQIKAIEAYLNLLDEYGID